MGLTLNAADAKKADNISTILRESGKYVGTITRAEKLLSRNKVEGLGLSFKSDDGASANYLDIYTVKPDGEKLRGFNIVQAIMCCLKLKTADEGVINFDKWNNEERCMVKASANGYPALMGKRIGLLLQKELQTHSVTGEDVERLNIVAVFEAATGLVATEILDGKTKAERIHAIEKMILSNPVRDTRSKKTAPASPAPQPAGQDDWNDDITF